MHMVEDALDRRALAGGNRIIIASNWRSEGLYFEAQVRELSFARFAGLHTRLANHRLRICTWYFDYEALLCIYFTYYQLYQDRKNVFWFSHYLFIVFLFAFPLENIGKVS